ncbi:Protein LURP-one-related 2 [Zea mays]|uniref:Protein LURP-one-related 2 n=1 Tax=Zea mays TaxID=4577 RepID=A0A1D6QGP9_MAIZE|nr:Protein LURP-one-related 2 [Zea mays]
MHPVPPRSSTTSSIAASATRVHPSDAVGGRATAASSGLQGQAPAVYTVWKRSSMGFQGTDGFSVYDATGSLAFRVDNYSRRRKLFAGELLLMDGRGAPLLALRPQILSMRDQWNCYRATSEEPSGDNDQSFRRRRRQQQLFFSMRQCSLVRGTDEVEVHMAAASGTSAAQQQVPSFTVQGSFWRRSCKIRRGGDGDGDGEEVARISRKKAAGAAPAPVTLGEDVFSLTVVPGADCAMVMAFVVVMDRICQRPYRPLMCSASSS